MQESKPIVLILDEDPLSLELYSRELTGDYLVITSASVQDTRQYLAMQALDILVIEPALNEGEGWILFQEIRLAKNPPPVILCSTDDERVAGLQQGAEAFLVKPVLPNTLHNLLNQIIAKKPYQTTQGF